MMTQTFHALEVGQATFLGRYEELALGNDAILVEVYSFQNLAENLFGFLPVLLSVWGVLP